MSNEIINSCGCCETCCPKLIHDKTFNCYYGTYEDINLSENGFPNKIDCDVSGELPEGFTYQWFFIIDESSGQRVAGGYIDTYGNFIDFPETLKVYCRYRSRVRLYCRVSNGLYIYKAYFSCPGADLILSETNNSFSFYAYLQYITGTQSFDNLPATINIYEIYDYFLAAIPDSRTLEDLVKNGRGRVTNISSTGFINGYLFGSINYNQIPSPLDRYPRSRFFYTVSSNSNTFYKPQTNSCEFYMDFGKPKHLVIEFENYPIVSPFFNTSNSFVAAIVDDNYNFNFFALVEKQIISRQPWFPYTTTFKYVIKEQIPNPIVTIRDANNKIIYDHLDIMFPAGGSVSSEIPKPPYWRQDPISASSPMIINNVNRMPDEAFPRNYPATIPPYSASTISLSAYLTNFITGYGIFGRTELGILRSSIIGVVLTE